MDTAKIKNESNEARSEPNESEIEAMSWLDGSLGLKTKPVQDVQSEEYEKEKTEHKILKPVVETKVQALEGLAPEAGNESEEKRRQALAELLNSDGMNIARLLEAANIPEDEAK